MILNSKVYAATEENTVGMSYMFACARYRQVQRQIRVRGTVTPEAHNTRSTHRMAQTDGPKNDAPGSRSAGLPATGHERMGGDSAMWRGAEHAGKQTRHGEAGRHARIYRGISCWLHGASGGGR